MIINNNVISICLQISLSQLIRISVWMKAYEWFVCRTINHAIKNIYKTMKTGY